MATIEGRKSVAKSRPRHQIPKRHRGHQNVARRLIDLVTQSPERRLQSLSANSARDRIR
jgi:hypothetical protein